jgi:hypothetical protein
MYAKRRSFIYGDPGIDHVDPEMLKVRNPSRSRSSAEITDNLILMKIFPVSLNRLLELSDRIQQSSVDVEGIKACNGCGKKAALSQRCGGCTLFWYCDSVRSHESCFSCEETNVSLQGCQKTGWYEKGHKQDCKLLRNHPDLGELFVFNWEKLDSYVRFPLTSSRNV